MPLDLRTFFKPFVDDFQDTFALFAFLVMLAGMAGLALFTFHRLRRDIADVL